MLQYLINAVFDFYGDHIVRLRNAKELGKIVSQLRKKARLSQSNLALRAGLSRTAIQNLESGKETLQLSTLFPVLDCLNATLFLNHPLLNERDA
jgi:transcriptional regulator with XRE-family HTH domain